MKEYIGVKKIKAEPMKRGAFDNKGKSLQDCTDPGDSIDGYQVTYEDGYTSWSPKNVFEKAYSLCPEGNCVDIQVDLNSGDWQFLNNEKESAE